MWKMTCGISEIVGPTGVYTGKSVNIEKRWERHVWELARNIHPCRRLQWAYEEFSLDAFQWRVVEVVVSGDNAALTEAEDRWLAANFARQYNATRQEIRAATSAKRLSGYYANLRKARALKRSHI
jgi:hypothetical protein